MPEARDRLARQEDFMASYSRISRIGNPSIGRGSSIVFVLDDENEEEQATRTPFRWRDTAMVGTPGSMVVAVRRGAIGSPRNRRIAPSTGPENLSPVVGSGRGRGRGSTLPTWYPRRPLNDITSVVRAIERRRDRQRDREGLETESPILQGRITLSPVTTGDISMITPRPMILCRRCPPTIGKVPKILLDITHKNDKDSDCLTPQKKLLNNIDKVEKVVMEELRKLKRTPSAKKAEREKRGLEMKERYSGMEKSDHLLMIELSVSPIIS